jgi:hypothetical protein
MVIVSEATVLASDNRGLDITILTLTTGETVEISISLCLELVQNAMENAASKQE